MTLHADALHVLRSWAPGDPATEVLRDDFAAYLAAHEDGLDRTCRPAHITASGIVLGTDGRVALVLHRKVGRWLQPGGHCEPGDATLAGAAHRESTEETGLAGLVLLNGGPVDLDVHPAPCRPGTADRHLDVRFAFVAEPGAEPTVSPESLDARWFPAADLPTDEPSVVRAVAAALLRLA